MVAESRRRACAFGTRCEPKRSGEWRLPDGLAERIDVDGGLLLSQESGVNRKFLIGEVVKTN